METVYTLCNVDRGVPEVWGSVFDLRDLITSAVKLADGKTLPEMDLPLKDRLALREFLKKVQGTEIEKLLRACGAL
ncbi:hypothetical protein [Pseudoscardovia radai]|uniref:hypothetical protein n=1 Tax=Pseudoscardovia radai TaxID=987066 RepID=UPI003992A47E